MAGVDEAALLTVTERAAEARLLAETPEGAGVRFAHALIREALYEGMPLVRRRMLHRRAGEALLAAPAPDPDAVAYHFQRAGDARSEGWLILAGERAQRAYAWQTAAGRYAAVLALQEQRGAAAGERGLLLFRLALLHQYSDPRQALRLLDEAARLAADDPWLTAYAGFHRGVLRCFTGDLGHGVPALEAGYAAVASLWDAGKRPPWSPARITRAKVVAGGDTAEGAELLLGGLVIWLGVAGRHAAALELGEAATARIDRAEPGAGPAGDGLGSFRGNLYAGLGAVYAALGRPGEAEVAFARARAEHEAATEWSQVGAAAQVELHRHTLPYRADRPAERERLAAVAAAGYERAATALGGKAVALHLPLWFLAGSWDEAWAEGWAEPDPTPRLLNTLRWRVLGPLARARGERALAAELVARLLPRGPATPPGEVVFLDAQALQRLAAGLAIDAGDLPEARAWLEAHDRWLAWGRAVLGRSEGALGWADYHRAAGDATLAREHAAQALAAATEPRQPLALLAAHRLLGELATDAGQHAEAAAHLDEARALADACAAPYERALMLLALAELRSTTGERAAADAALAEARALLEPMEACPALARADALAARLAGPAAAPAYPAGLTAREAEVLRLVARGLSNAEVGARLFLSPRTVNSHLTHIYTKLGVEGRPAAIRAALDLGLR